MTPATAADRTRWISIRVVAGCVLGVGALWLTLRGSDPAQLWRTIEQAQPLWLVAALASVGVTLAAIVLRWRVLLQHPAGPALWGTLFHAAIVGQMLNILLPIRLGEFARAYLVSRSEGIPAARVFTTIAVEKLGDMMAAGLAAAWLVAFVSLPAWVHRPAGALVMVGIAAAAGAVLLSTRAEALVWLVRPLARAAPSAWRTRLEAQMASALEGLSGVRTWQGTAALGVLSMAVLLLAAATNYLLFLAFRLSLPATAAVFLLIALQVGNAVVSVPGNLGVFHYVTVLVLSSYGVERRTAVAYALVLYGVAIATKVAAGAAFLLFGRTRLDLHTLAVWRRAGT
jgi:uncharacterized protein (TIRG00374 family)